MTPWLVTGAGGQLGSVLLRQLCELGMDAVGVVSPTGPKPERGKTVALDLLDTPQLERLIAAVAPARIIHAAALTAVADCFRDPARAERINVSITRALAGMAEHHGSRFVQLSTDMVFDGERPPYAESAEPAPSTVYGRSKLQAERAALGLAPTRAVVVRVPLLYGIPAVQRSTTFLAQIDAIRARRPLKLFHDEVRTPLWLEDAAHAVRRVAESELLGIVHAGGQQALSRLQMGRLVADALGIADPPFEATSSQKAGDLEPRPRDLSLLSQRYAERFGVAPGRPMAEALALAFAR